MFLFSKPDIEQLIKNFESNEVDHIPVAKLFIPRTSFIWLVTEVDPNEPLNATALYDAGDGVISLAEVNLGEILHRGYELGPMVQRDPRFVGKYPVSVYLRAALHYGYITDQDLLINRFKNPFGLSP